MKRNVVDITTARVSSEPDPPSPYSDIALSNRFVKKYGDDLRYVAKLDRWFFFDEDQGRWIVDEKLFVWTLAKRLCAEVAREARKEIDDEKAAAGTAKAISSAKTVAAILSLARSHPLIAAVESQFDANNWLLNTFGGVAVDLLNGNLRKARREDYFTKTTQEAPVDMPTP